MVQGAQMSLLFRGLLIVGAILAFAYILRKIRKSEIKIADSTFWFVFALGIVLLALFPEIAHFFCRVFSIESPVNFVYLVIITILVIRQFMATVEISSLRNKLATLVQEEALAECERTLEERE